MLSRIFFLLLLFRESNVFKITDAASGSIGTDVPDLNFMSASFFFFTTALNCFSTSSSRGCFVNLPTSILSSCSTGVSKIPLSCLRVFIHEPNFVQLLKV